jgi:hypothetical protein
VDSKLEPDKIQFSASVLSEETAQVILEVISESQESEHHSGERDTLRLKREIGHQATKTLIKEVSGPTIIKPSKPQG